MKLVDRQIWDQYFKFSFVRNPYDRAHSDYLWMMKDRGVSGTFEEYITASGPFERFLAHSQEKTTRNEHLTPQYEFLYDENGALLVDKVYRFESLEADFKDICNRLGITYSSLPHVKKNTQKAHYRDFYDVNTKSLVEEKYGKDLELFNYSF